MRSSPITLKCRDESPQFKECVICSGQNESARRFLPRSVQFTLEGSSIAGGRNVHEGPGLWETMKQKLRYIVHLPEQPPDFALSPYNPERPVRIHFVTHIMMGGVDIYRL